MAFLSSTRHSTPREYRLHRNLWQCDVGRSAVFDGSVLGGVQPMALVEIKNAWHLRRMKETGEIFRAKKLGFAFYLIESARGEPMGRHLAKVVEELSEAVDASNS